MADDMPYARRELHSALTEWKDAGMDVRVLADYIEGFISVKVHEILQAREDNARAGDSATGDSK